MRMFIIINWPLNVWKFSIIFSRNAVKIKHFQLCVYCILILIDSVKLLSFVQLPQWTACTRDTCCLSHPGVCCSQHNVSTHTDSNYWGEVLSFGGVKSLAIKHLLLVSTFFHRSTGQQGFPSAMNRSSWFSNRQPSAVTHCCTFLPMWQTPLLVRQFTGVFSFWTIRVQALPSHTSLLRPSRT